VKESLSICAFRSFSLPEIPIEINLKLTSWTSPCNSAADIVVHVISNDIEKGRTMKCIEFLAEYSRCERGIPVGHLFRHYFCESEHQRCPLKRIEKVKKRRAVSRRDNSFIGKGGA